MVFTLFLTNNQVPNKVAQWIGEANLNVFMFFLVTQHVLHHGHFHRSSLYHSYHLAHFASDYKHLGIDPIHFAIVITVNMELAMITPPVSLNFFVVSSMAKERLEEVVKGVLSFIAIMIAVLLLLVVWPDISLYLPRHVMK